MEGRLPSALAAGLLCLALAPTAQAHPHEPEPTPEPVAAEPTVLAQGVDPRATPEPTPTPTPTPTPGPTAQPSAAQAEDAQADVGKTPEDASKRVRSVYRDYRRDALITPCDHSLRALIDTRESITEEFEREFPDFTESVQAAIEERRIRDCARENDDPAGEREPRESATPTPTPTPAPSATPAPLPVDPAPLPDSGTSSLGELPPDPLEVAPLPGTEEPAPLPQQTQPLPEAVPGEPVPEAVPPVPAEAPVADVAPEPASAPAPVWGLAAGGGALALGGLLAPLLAAPAGGRLAALRHAWAEAGFRARGAWLDFRDWLRVGR